MSPLNHKSSAEPMTKALYCAWKGQLYIQQQRVCDIVLRSPFSGSIPAELPARLEIRYVVGISELRKKLPEAVFGKNNYTNHEVCHQGILFGLYEVETLNQNEQKVNQLTESLKEKDLALVKYLNDRGILILLSSSALVKEKDSGPGESTCLQALFLISSPKPECLTAKDLKCEPGANERSLQVALLLPGLRHALVEAVKPPGEKGAPLSTLVEQHLREFGKLDQKNPPPTSSLDSPPPSSFDVFSKRTELEALSGKCPQSSLSHLQFYLSHPQNYALEMSTATACLHGRSQSPSSSLREANTSSGSNLDSLPRDEPIGTVEMVRTRSAGQPAAHSKEADVNTSQMGEQTLQQTKRKSSRLLMASARKKLSPPEAPSSQEGKRKQKNARKENLSVSSPASKNLESSGGSNEPTLKLKNLQNPLRKKRGAEVLSAEFVQQTPCEPAANAAPSPGSLGVGEKKARVSKGKKDSAAEKVSGEMKMSTRNQMKRKSSHQREDEMPPASQGEAGDENDPSSERSLAQDACPSPQVDNCDSHALNMLADLALSSNSPLYSNGSGASLPPSPSRRRSHKGKLSGKSSDHEYHRVTKKLKPASLSGRTCPESVLYPEQTDGGRESPSSSYERDHADSSKRWTPQTTPPRETGYLSDSSIHSLISSEHSYASPVSESCRRGPQFPHSSKNGVKNARGGALVGKVMPFRHQQRICHPHKQLSYMPFPRSAAMAARLKEDFSKSHKVTICDKTVKVTFQCEAEYSPNLDSKYTNIALEKTICRAVHGPWDTRLLDDSDEMVRILNMWAALFYRKPFTSLTIRNVVEHSNPAKVVALKSIVNSSEVVNDNSEGPYSLEKCPADSLSNDNQAPREADERAVSSSEKPLSCNELSSTNCIEDEAPIVIPDDPSDLPLKEKEEEEEESHVAASKPKENVHPFDKVAAKEPDEQLPSDPVLSAKKQNENLSEEPSEVRLRPRECGTDAEATASVDLAEVSQSDAVSKDVERLEDPASKQPSVNTVAGGISAKEICEIKASSPPAEEKEDSPQSGGTMLLRPPEIAWLEADSDCREDDRPCRDGRESQDLPVDEEDVEGESMGWESIDLALSDSNDADTEPRDMDLDEENEDKESCAEEDREAARASSIASSGGSPFISPSSPATVSESPGTQEGFILATPNSASLDPADVVKGFCLSEEDREDNLFDSLRLRTSPVKQITHGEVAQSPETVDAVELVKHPITPNQMDVADSTRRSQEDHEINLEDSASPQAAELKDMTTQGESVESRDSILLANSPRFPNQVGLDGTSFGSTEEKGMTLADAVSPEPNRVHQTSPDGVIELPTAQEDSAETSKRHISLNQMDLIEDISKEEGNLADSSLLHTCGLSQVHSSTSAQGESIGKEENSALSAPSLAPEKEIDLVGSSCVSSEEGGIHVADVFKLQISPVYQAISDEEEDLLENQEHKAENATEQMRPAVDSCIPQKKEAFHLVGAPPLQADELWRSPVPQEERKARQTTEPLGDSQGQSRHSDNEESDTSTDNPKCGINSEDIEVSPVPRESASEDDELRQAVVPVPEDIKSCLCELLDTVSGMTAESKEEASAKENPALNWISSVTLECVTPPESDEESYAADQLAHYDHKWAMAGDRSAQPSNKRDSHMAGQRYGWYHSALQGSISSSQATETKSHQETEAAADTLESSCCLEWEDTGTRSPEPQFPLIQAAALGGVEPGQVSSEVSMFEGEDRLGKAGRKKLPFMPSAMESLTEESGPPAYEDAEDLYENLEENLEDPEDAPAGERPELSAGATGMHMNWEDKYVSADGVPELCGGAHHRGQPEIPCTRSVASPDAMELSCASDLSCENDLHKGEDWMYLENKVTVPDVEAETVQYDWPPAFTEGDRSVLPSLEESGPQKEFLNFTITKKHQAKSRTFHAAKRRSTFPGEVEWKNFSDRAWRVLNDPIQSTLDMECLRFHDKLKHTLKKPQPPTSGEGTRGERLLQVTAEMLPSRKVPEAPELSVPPRSRSPLLITILNRSPRHSAPHSTSRSRHSDPLEPPPSPPIASAQEPVSNAARTKGQGQGPAAPFHLNKLTYTNKLKDSRGDISVIMDEFAELSRLMTQGDRQASFVAREPNPTSEDDLEKRCPSLPRGTTFYEDLFTELCSTLHFKLKTVAQEACKKPYAFYLVETGDNPCFGRLKNLLKKGSHMEMKPQQFCKTSHPEGDRLMVIIRNEDIYPHIYKIPSLLKLKHFPSVTFVGVDNPEDIFDHTYQELFHSGGFMVSDDKVLEAMTVGELKEAIKTLEKLNSSHGSWSWLLHYKETKRLREEARKDPAAHTKELLLKSCQGANLTQVIHYHQCDSKSSPRSEYRNCLLNLQVQHISRRFAVFLTEKPSASREAMESKGILVLDVKTFVATAENLVAPFRSGSW